MKRGIIAVAAMAAVALFATAGHASQDAFDQQMNLVLAEYLKIGDTLASDKMDGVAVAAGAIVTLSAKLDASGVEPGHAKHYQGIAQKVPEAAKKIQAAADIKTARKAFAELSKPMVMWVEHQSTKPATVVYCSMYPGSWLQKGKDIRNPYYGAKMLTCGEVVGDGKKDDHSGHH
ncbi:MAG: DUF3347 domain-containing protein [Deltaproteobacteria bacterium]|nr:DUF3347 domain-containing protein [Deltaproteobacteria bacterium]